MSSSAPQPDWICPHCLSQVKKVNRQSWGVLWLALLLGAGTYALWRGGHPAWAATGAIVSLLTLVISTVSGPPYCGVCEADGIIPLATPRGRQLLALSHLEPGGGSRDKDEEPRTFPSSRNGSTGTH
jgi:hypothetical protein